MQNLPVITKADLEADLKALGQQRAQTMQQIERSQNAVAQLDGALQFTKQLLAKIAKRGEPEAPPAEEPAAK